MRILVVTQYDDAVGPMVAAFLRDYSMRLEAVSVGKKPAQTLHPLVVEAMKECLVDLEGYAPKDVSEVDEKGFDLIIEWPETPLPSDLDAFRVVRDNIKNESFLYYRDVLRKRYSI